MKKLNKITAMLLALTASCTLAGFIGCDDDPAESSSTPPSSSVSSEVNDNACTDAHGHAYDESTGLCEHCGKKAVIPALSATLSYPLVEPCTHTNKGNCPECLYQGAGEIYNRIELFLNEGYTIEIGSSGIVWLSFSALEYAADNSTRQSGQFVLHSVGGTNGITVKRHSANSQYVSPEGRPAVEENGEFYSYVNCSDAENNSEWRATYCLQGTAGATVKVRFVRIADPRWEPQSVRTNVYAQELTQKAPEPETDKQLVEVDYDASYFYSDPADGGDGYYHLGSKEEPGEIIYAAIDRNAPRLFSDGKFTNVLQNFGTALNLVDGFTADGDYNVLCYTPFIMNWVDENAVWGSRPGSEVEAPEADPNKVCYQNYCNSDGVYPVNAELFKFLNLYVAENKPVDTAITESDWTEKKDWLWLSACFYYTDSQIGTQHTPLHLKVGENTVSTLEYDFLYCGFAESGSYTVTCTDERIDLGLNGDIIPAPFSITVSNTDVFNLSTRDGSVAENVVVNVVKNVTEELTLGDIPLLLPAGGKAVVSGILAAGNYEAVWTGENLSVKVNGVAYTAGDDFTVTESVDGAPNCVVEITNGGEAVSLTLTVREPGLTVGENALSIKANQTLFVKFYAEKDASYSIVATGVVVSNTVNNMGITEVGSQITEITVGTEGYVTVAIQLPVGATADGTGTVTFTKKA